MGGSVFQQVEEFQLTALGHLLLAEVIEEQHLRPAAAGQHVLGQRLGLVVVMPLIGAGFGECSRGYPEYTQSAEMQSLEQHPRRPCLAASRWANETHSDRIILPCLAFAQEGVWDSSKVALAVEWWAEGIECLLPPLLLRCGLLRSELLGMPSEAILAQHPEVGEIARYVLVGKRDRLETFLARTGLVCGHHCSTSSTLAGANAGSTLLSQPMTNIRVFLRPGLANNHASILRLSASTSTLG